MLYRRMQRIKEELSILGFGCMRLPIVGGSVDEKEADVMMNVALDNGVNYIDTARPYHGGKGEGIVGRLLRGKRDKVMLATKLPSWLIKNQGDMHRHLDEQLKELQTDRIDLYLLHALTKERWENLLKNNVFDFMEKMRSAGKIRYIAFSFHDGLNVFKDIVDAYPWDMCQIQYNLVDVDFQAGREGLHYAHSRGIGVVAMEPLRGGNIAIPIPQEMQALAEKAKYNKPNLADLALRWIWEHKEVSVLLSGASSVQQMQENIASANATSKSMSKEEMDLVEQVSQYYSRNLQVPCTSCGYCDICPKSVDIPQCFTLLNNGALSGNWEAQKKIYHYILADDREGKKASQCVECGMCEKICPQNIAIIAKLKEVAHAFE